MVLFLCSSLVEEMKSMPADGSRRALLGVAYWRIGMDSKSIVKRKEKDKRIMIQG